jgi:hypothetical protein
MIAQQQAQQTQQTGTSSRCNRQVQQVQQAGATKNCAHRWHPDFSITIVIELHQHTMRAHTTRVRPHSSEQYNAKGNQAIEDDDNYRISRCCHRSALPATTTTTKSHATIIRAPALPHSPTRRHTTAQHSACTSAIAIATFQRQVAPYLRRISAMNLSSIACFMREKSTIFCTPPHTTDGQQ